MPLRDASLYSFLLNLPGNQTMSAEKITYMGHDSICKNAVQLTRHLVQIPSESSEPISTVGPPEAGVTSFLAKICQEHQINFSLQEALPDRYNLVVSLPKEDVPKILFLAHMDTVSAKGMAHPFRAASTGKTISGRGACDDKGPLASLFATILGLKEKGVQQNFDITMVCTVDEENTMSGAARFAKETTQKYDICVALEPSLLQPIARHKGAYRCRIFPNMADATPPAGESSIKRKERMKDIMSDLSSFKKKEETLEDPQLGQTSITITEIEGDYSTNSIANSYRILVDIRMLPCQTPAQMHSKITRIIGSKGKIVPLFAGLGIDSNPADPFIQQFQTSLLRQGLPDDLIAAPFPSDCSQLRGQRTCLVWGPGDPKHAHATEEYIEISQIEGACRVLTDFLSSS